jgi:hypothetical protein
MRVHTVWEGVRISGGNGGGECIEPVECGECVCTPGGSVCASFPLRVCDQGEIIKAEKGDSNVVEGRSLAWTASI